MTELTLEDLRGQIDQIDKQLLQLLRERATCATQVGQIKRSQQQTETLFYRPEREAKVLRNIMQQDCSPLPEKEMARIFRSIMSACLALQEPIKVAFLGPEGTFSQAAALEHFGGSVNLTPAQTIANVFDFVESRKVQYGIVPVENSVGGTVTATIEQLIETNANICGELNLAIQQNLLANKDNQSIDKIYSHEQSFAQCDKWLSRFHPNAQRIVVSSNARAAELAAAEVNSAAVAGVLCADLYGLEILAQNIEDSSDNVTRFLIIGLQNPEASGTDRTSLLVTLEDIPGALEKLINHFSKQRINLTMIKSMRCKAGKYSFFLDADVHQDDEVMQNIISDLSNNNVTVKVLGSYPQAAI